ncbi:Protein TIFY 8 [Hibiscus syriacus]|uniref:Protein TIFY n=1 Tax=Hibiscus syriacus TaxID=106335 RepID=A0A6A3BAL7_HIBSY|nr:Protein TIFY 8 [Hibiscus syriacus]
MAHESLEILHLMKMLHNGSGGDRPRRSNEDDVFLGMKSMRHSSTSLILHPPTVSSLEGDATKWERSVPSAVQYASRGGHFAPFVHQASNRFKDSNVGPSVISQAAADEGSRTGIKCPGILSFITASSVPTEKGSSGIVPSGERTKSAHISETESLVPPSEQRLTTSSQQMTIFYAGRAHVFDDVHPKKADVILALAGSNGGSWSTTYSPKSAARTVGENYVPDGEPEAVGNMAFSRELRGKTTLSGNVNQATGSCNRIPIQTGTVVMAREGRNLVQAEEAGTEDKREHIRTASYPSRLAMNPLRLLN